MRARGDRGAIPLIPLIIAAVVVAGAAATGTVLLVRNQGSNSGGFTVSVTGATAQRDDNDLPQVLVQYKVDFQSDGAASAVIVAPTVRCTASQGQLTRTRTFTGEAQVIVSTRIAAGVVAIAPGEDSKAAQGPYKVACELIRDGAVLDSASGGTVTIPPPSTESSSSSASESSSVGPGDLPPVVEFAGTYTAPFTRVDGNEENCSPTDARMVVVTPTSPTTLKVELDSASIYEGPLASDLTFMTTAGLYPGHPDYFGQLKGQFFRGATTDLAINLVTTEPRCTYAFTAHRT